MHRTGHPPAIEWTDALLLGEAGIDADHQVFVELVRAVQAAADGELLGRLEALSNHAREHFERENTWMAETGFSARLCHVEEHNAVLASVAEVLALARQGDREVVRRLADELARWFPGHLHFLDSALAQWLCKQRYGGKPVVLKRLAAAHTAPAV